MQSRQSSASNKAEGVYHFRPNPGEVARLQQVYCLDEIVGANQRSVFRPDQECNGQAEHSFKCGEVSRIQGRARIVHKHQMTMRETQPVILDTAMLSPRLRLCGQWDAVASPMVLINTNGKHSKGIRSLVRSSYTC
jgi:hypothetical protein